MFWRQHQTSSTPRCCLRGRMAIAQWRAPWILDQNIHFKALMVMVLRKPSWAWLASSSGFILGYYWTAWVKPYLQCSSEKTWIPAHLFSISTIDSSALLQEPYRRCSTISAQSSQIPFFLNSNQSIRIRWMVTPINKCRAASRHCHCIFPNYLVFLSTFLN